MGNFSLFSSIFFFNIFYILFLRVQAKVLFTIVFTSLRNGGISTSSLTTSVHLEFPWLIWLIYSGTDMAMKVMMIKIYFVLSFNKV